MHQESEHKNIPPDMIRDVHRLLVLLKRSRTAEGISDTDERVIDRLSKQIAQIDGQEMIELMLNNAPLISRCLMK